MRPTSRAQPTRPRSRRKVRMLMSVIEGARSAPAYPELAGKRVLITGLTSSCGVDIARAFADHKARLILQFDEMSERTQAIAEIAANRMALSYIEGLILNVAILTPPMKGPAQAFASVAKAALSAMTRIQAEEWAGKAIRFNAIAPQTAHPSAEPSLAGEPEVAALALYLASGRGKALSGHVFEAEPAR